ncbi:hypothetical protein [Vibrio algicola]|uniref:hypothetical protein n=1 Tax=Vibrio algicola TaxID=2662262 RepID=UPI0015B46F3C|nr:hypothetical protein [Vibrio algicola]
MMIFIFFLPNIWLIFYFSAFVALIYFLPPTLTTEKNNRLIFHPNMNNSQWDVHLKKTNDTFHRQHYKSLDDTLTHARASGVTYICLSSPMLQKGSRSRQQLILAKLVKKHGGYISSDISRNGLFNPLGALKLYVCKNILKMTALATINPFQWRTIIITLEQNETL